MSTITVGSIIDLVEKKAVDENNDDFSQAELIKLYNLALRLIVSLVPRAYTITTVELLAAGSFQSIPSDGLMLIDVLRNMGTGGATPGASIREVAHGVMRAYNPNWSTETAAVAIKTFMRIPQMDASFYCSPPSDGTGYVQLTYSATPPTTTYDAGGAWESNLIPLSDEYVSAVPDAILFHAYDDDTDIPGNTPKSQMYYQRVLTILGVKDQHARERL